MQPQVAMIACPMTEPRMDMWTSLSPRLGNGTSSFRFTSDFFAWWRMQFMVIKDFPYVGVDFRGSVDLVLPKGIQWDASGMKNQNLGPYIYVFCCTVRDLNHFVFIMQKEVHHIRWRFQHWGITKIHRYQSSMMS
jgi:hypothetical protein